jgi:WD40 repeat protein
VFSGGCDKQVKLWPLLEGAQPITVAMHDEPVKEVAWISQMNLLASGSWDKTIRLLAFVSYFSLFIGNHEIYISELSFIHFLCVMMKYAYAIVFRIMIH